MESFSIKENLNASVATVYNALTNPDDLKNWWTKFAEVEPHVGGKANFRFPKAGFFANFVITALETNKRVEWVCVECRHPASTKFKNRSDWIGTRVIFTLKSAGKDRTKWRFEHEGLTTELECYDSSTKGWQHFFSTSFKPYVETGKGQPYTDDSQNNID
jgi:uncharacterized protein YndB with AHSA1/START domain